MESTSKEIALELLFLEGSGDRMRLLRIPRRSSSADVENLDAALWALAQMDSEIRHGLVLGGTNCQSTVERRNFLCYSSVWQFVDHAYRLIYSKYSALSNLTYLYLISYF